MVVDAGAEEAARRGGEHAVAGGGLVEAPPVTNRVLPLRATCHRAASPPRGAAAPRKVEVSLASPPVAAAAALAARALARHARPLRYAELLERGCEARRRPAHGGEQHSASDSGAVRLRGGARGQALREGRRGTARCSKWPRSLPPAPPPRRCRRCTSRGARARRRRRGGARRRLLIKSLPHI